MSYPKRLRALRTPPSQLEVLGRTQIFQTMEQPGVRVVAIVGARAASVGETTAAYELALALAQRGVIVVSGGAIGVDTAAHQGALAAHPASGASYERGSTIAVLGCGVGVTYPERNRALFEEIRVRGGVLISQFDTLASPRPWHFVRRNQVIAGMADAVVVMAAGRRSGALHTARAARELGRVVCAMPGRPGCDALIAAGAAVVRNVRECEDALSGKAVKPAICLPPHDTPGFLVLSCLNDIKSRDINDINAETGLSVRDINRALTSLELDGLVTHEPGRRFVCTYLARELLAS